MAESPRVEPSLHRRHLAGLVGRQDQRRHQLDASVPLGRVQQVLDGHRGGPVGLVPVGSSQMQFRDDVGLDSTQFAEQELAEQGVVAVPLAPTIERDQEQARPRGCAAGPARPSLRGRRRTAERTVDRAPPCAAGTADRSRAGASTTRGTGSRPRTGRHPRSSTPRRCLSRAITAARYRPTGQPSVRSVTAAASSRVRCTRPREDLLGAGRVEGQVARPGTPARHPTPAAAAGGAARNDSPRPVASLGESPRSPRSARRDRPATASS